MSLQNMNQMQLVPKKDYGANRLVSGALQLAKNTSLFLDETQLEQGQLDTTGEAYRNHKRATGKLTPTPLRSLLTLPPYSAAWEGLGFLISLMMRTLEVVSSQRHADTSAAIGQPHQTPSSRSFSLRNVPCTIPVCCSGLPWWQLCATGTILPEASHWAVH
ncbi:hypothetical protein GOODEAATRI_029194 [Goodea atripinnis]|uniref:Mini-chromosome maintenance complex-binding protein n=1 Tax=Goodea atripinnis TaxID=208336 RepID=A0ABV0NEK4_9TELE